MYFYIFLYKSFLLKTLFKQADVISPCFFYDHVFGAMHEVSITCV